MKTLTSLMAGALILGSFAAYADVGTNLVCRSTNLNPAETITIKLHQIPMLISISDGSDTISVVAKILSRTRTSLSVADQNGSFGITIIQEDNGAITAKSSSISGREGEYSCINQ